MDKATFLKIFNILIGYGSTRPSKSSKGKSLVCFAIVPIAEVQPFIPEGWTIRHCTPAWNAEQGKMSPAMTVLSPETEPMTADTAFAGMKF